MSNRVKKRDLNIAQNNRDYVSCHNRAALRFMQRHLLISFLNLYRSD